MITLSAIRGMAWLGSIMNKCKHNIPKGYLCDKCHGLYQPKKDYFDGRAEMKQEIIDIIRPCLVRDVTLQKIIHAIEELK